MSRRARPALPLLVAASLLLAALPASSMAAQRLESFALPSTQGNVDVTKVKLNKIDSLRATVLLPDGYDEQPDASWPVVYLLSGIGDNSEAWAFPGTGNVQALAKGLPAIVVMPESGRGFNVDWYDNNRRGGPNWMSYLRDEVIPSIESKYRIKPGRQFHAIGGVSMGAYGAMELAGQLPSYFGTVVSMSALVDSQNPESFALLPSSIGAKYEDVWGPVGGPYATALNPIKNVENMTHTRQYLSTGNAIPDITVPFNGNAWTAGVAIEGFALAQNVRYAIQLAAAKAPHVLKIRPGVHDWPYWRRELPKAISWGLFSPPPYPETADATSWIYKTMSQHGNAWGYGYKLATVPSGPITLRRNGQLMRGAGVGIVQINPGAADADASGAGSKPECSFTAVLPFSRTLPAGC